MKYEYKVVMKDEAILSELGIRTFDKAKGCYIYNENPVDIGFANELGEDGFEMFQVIKYEYHSMYYFRKEHETSSDIRKRKFG